MKMEQRSEISAYKIQTPGNYPEESIQHSEHGKSLKCRILHLYGEETARQIQLFKKLRIISSHLPAYDDGTYGVFQNVFI